MDLEPLYKRSVYNRLFQNIEIRYCEKKYLDTYNLILNYYMIIQSKLKYHEILMI